MEATLLMFGFIAVGAGMLAVFAVYAHAFLASRDLSDDGPRAFIAEFVGLWIACFFLVWSFLTESMLLEWLLQIAAAFFTFAAIVLRIGFVNPSPGPELVPRQPAGLENDTTDLHSD